MKQNIKNYLFDMIMSEALSVAATNRFLCREGDPDVKNLACLFSDAGYSPLNEYQLSLVRLNLADRGMVISLDDLKNKTITDVIANSLLHSTYPLGSVSEDYVSININYSDSGGTIEEQVTGLLTEHVHYSDGQFISAPQDFEDAIFELKERFPNAFIVAVKDPVRDVIKQIEETYEITMTGDQKMECAQKYRELLSDRGADSMLENSSEWGDFIDELYSQTAGSICGIGLQAGSVDVEDICQGLCSSTIIYMKEDGSGKAYGEMHEDERFSDNVVEACENYDIPALIELSLTLDEENGFTVPVMGDFFIIPEKHILKTNSRWGFCVGRRDAEEIADLYNDLK